MDTMNNTEPLSLHEVVEIKQTRAGLVQAKYDHGYTLSVGFGAGHYASFLFGSRMDEDGSQFIPTSYEVAVIDPNGNFVPMTSYDDVAANVSLDRLQAIKGRMESASFDPRDLELYCE